MTWKITPTYAGAVSDADAAAYLAAVEAADGQLLEPAVRQAVNSFVVGCKADGIWPAIKASCIMAGARTLNGALVPLVGVAPTNFNFVAGDYNRKTGLAGGVPKYLETNRASSADPAYNTHQSVYATTLSSGGGPSMISDRSVSTSSGVSYISYQSSITTFGFNSRSGGDVGITSSAVGLIGQARTSSSNVVVRVGGVSSSQVRSTNITSTDNSYKVFTSGNFTAYSNARLSFYSIGEALNLALLDARLTTLMADLAAAIP